MVDKHYAHLEQSVAVCSSLLFDARMVDVGSELQQLIQKRAKFRQPNFSQQIRDFLIFQKNPHLYWVFLVGGTGIEPVTPTMSR